jgi:hypothetical protein
MTKHPLHSQIPEFATREEEAEFWDSHDVTDYLDELKPAPRSSRPATVSRNHHLCHREHRGKKVIWVYSK